MIALGTGLAVGIAALLLTLARAPVTVARANTAQTTFLGSTDESLLACQSGEVLPRATPAIRLRLDGFLGPRVKVALYAHGSLLTHGEQGSGWTGGVVTIPVHPLPTTRSGVRLCFGFSLNGAEHIELIGERTTPAHAAYGYGPGGAHRPLVGRLRVEYLRPAASTWWSLALPVARRMGLGRAWAGTWGALLVVALMSSLVLLCSRLILRGLT
jgi:hypothetical protein